MREDEQTSRPRGGGDAEGQVASEEHREEESETDRHARDLAIANDCGPEHPADRRD